MAARKGTIVRDTAETSVTATVSLDGSGKAKASTGNGMLDHLLAQLAKHSLMDIDIETNGDPETGWHHTVEDTGIALGRALNLAIGEGTGIYRMGHALVPLDEALAQVAIDFCGRGFASIEIGLSNMNIADLPGDLVRHFLQTFAVESKSTLHVKILSGINGHHMAEATFKALAKAIRDAIALDPRSKNRVPSTKGTISG